MAAIGVILGSGTRTLFNHPDKKLWSQLTAQLELNKRSNIGRDTRCVDFQSSNQLKEI